MVFTGSSRVALSAVVLCAAACSQSSFISPGTPTPLPSSCPQPSTILPQPFGPIPCLTAAELQSVARDVTLTFENDPSGSELVCRAADGSADLTSLQKAIYDAILYMRAARFDAPLPWTSDSLYSWFVHAQQGIRVRNRNSGCCDPPGVITISSSFRATSSSIPYPLEVLVHEARHAEGYPHTCHNTADNTIDELGAWGVQYYLMVWLGTHASHLNAEEREYALNRAEWLRSSGFCFECSKPAASNGPLRVPAWPGGTGLGYTWGLVPGESRPERSFALTL